MGKPVLFVVTASAGQDLMDAGAILKMEDSVWNSVFTLWT